MGAFTNLIQCGGVEGGDGVRVDSCSGPPRAARSRAGPSIKFRGFGNGAYTHVGAWARRTHKNLDIDSGLGIIQPDGEAAPEGRQ